MEDDVTDEEWTERVYFWVGLFGIVATGVVVGMGGDNYWAVGRAVDASAVLHRGTALLGVLLFLVGLCDLVAFGVIFAGAVLVVQRLRGVSSE